MRFSIPCLTLLIAALSYSQDATSFTKQGDDAFAAKQYDQAVQAYIQAIKLNPNSADLYDRLGRVYQIQHNSRYILAFRKAEELRQTKPAEDAKPAPAAAGQNSGCQIGMVVRAGVLNYDAKIVAFNPASGLYKVQFVTGYKGTIEWMPPSDLKTCKAPPIAAVSEPWFIGVWQLMTGGGGAWQKNPVTNSWKVVGLDVAKAPPIRISANGTFDWVIDAAKTVSGRWRRAEKSELKYGYDKLGTVIILLNGEDGKNWLVTRKLVSTEDGRDKILIERTDLGLTYWGNRVGELNKPIQAAQ